MADYSLLAPIIIKHETWSYTNDPVDLGGSTFAGITFATYKSVYGSDKTVEDLKKLTVSQWYYIFKKYYWDAMNATGINNQSFANTFVDYGFGSGQKTAIKTVQNILNWHFGYNLSVDGVNGEKTLKAINSVNNEQLFDYFTKARLAHYLDIKTKYPAQSKFYNGWCNRANSYKFVAEKKNDIGVFPIIVSTIILFLLWKKKVKY